MLANLPASVEVIVRCLQERSATAGDGPQLMAAVPALAQVLRYGNVRQTDAQVVAGVFDGIVARACIGLPGACLSLDDEAAGEMFLLIQGMNQAIELIQNQERLQAWRTALRTVADQDGVHGLVRGRAVRLLHDAHVLPAEEIGRRMSMALSMAVAANVAAAWIEGFLRGSGLILIHDVALWRIIDRWVCQLRDDHFNEVVPLLRRTFATFPAPERRQMGERVIATSGGTEMADAESRPSAFDAERAARVIPILKLILGSTENAE